MTKSPVRISDIGLYLRCPRMVYFDSLNKLIRRDDPNHLLLKSLMLSISGESDLESRLSAALARLEQELTLVYEIDAIELESACRELEERIPELADYLSAHLRILLPCEVEVDLRSERLGLSGRLDRLASGRIPSLIRTGQAPQDGVWKRDRLMLAGYALMLSEMNQMRIGKGLVEYPRSGVVRQVQIHSIDRSRVLRIRDRVQQIKEGTLPDRPEDAPCENCAARESCQTRVSLASKFF